MNRENEEKKESLKIINNQKSRREHHHGFQLSVQALRNGGVARHIGALSAPRDSVFWVNGHRGQGSPIFIRGGRVEVEGLEAGGCRIL
jgi:hypothetical protein